MRQNRHTYTLLLGAALLLGISVLLNIAGGLQLLSCKQENAVLAQAAEDARSRAETVEQEAKKSLLERAVKENAVSFAETYFTRDGNPLADRTDALRPYATPRLLAEYAASLEGKPTGETSKCRAQAVDSFWRSDGDGAQVLVLCRLALSTDGADAESGVLLTLAMKQNDSQDGWLVDRIVTTLPVNLPASMQKENNHE